jgi:hypothetical protein
MWWEDILIAALLIAGIYCFASLAGFRARTLSHRSGRTAEGMYDQYADSARKQRQYARDHGGTWKDGES